MTSPRVSVVMPCRNEARYIADVVRSIFEADQPDGGMEVLVADGMSDDGTRDILLDLVTRYPDLRIIDNPARTVPVGLNAAIRAARGEVIVRVDAHTYYPKDYFTQCVDWLERTGADSVGGALVAEPSEDTVFGRAIARSIDHPFGSGNAHHKASRNTEPREVDTVPFGCFRKELFDRVGYFREDLARSQDMEFNIRLRKMGGRILLVPSIRSHYQVRSNFRQILRYYFSNGFWVLFTLKFGVVAFKLRHLIPFFFVSWLLLFGFLSIWSHEARILFLLASGLYGACALAASTHIAVRERRPEFVFTVPFAFALLHIVHGVGTLYALVCVLLEKFVLRGVFAKETPTSRV